MKKRFFLAIILNISIFSVDIICHCTNELALGFTANASNRDSEHTYTRDRNSDGFIYKGTVYLKKVGSQQKVKFLLFEKRGVKYAAKYKAGPYYKITHRMKIDNVEYIYEG